MTERAQLPINIAPSLETSPENAPQGPESSFDIEENPFVNAV